MVGGSETFLIDFLKTAAIRASTSAYLNGCVSWTKKLKQTDKKTFKEPNSKQL